jgi:hypothetical protein
MAYIDNKGEWHWCTFDIDKQIRNKIRQQWRDSKTLSNLIALLKSDHAYRKEHGGMLARIVSKWKFRRYERWMRGLVAQANRSAFNVAAREKLKEAKLQIRPDSLHFLQLAEWGLSLGLAPENPGGNVIAMAVKDLKIDEPKRVAMYFENRAIQPTLDEEHLAGTPEVAAKNLLMVLAMRLQADPKLREVYGNAVANALLELPEKNWHHRDEV